MIEKIMAIAEEELGLKAGSISTTARFENLFTDSLEWLEFINHVREKCGDLTDEQATAAETFEELAKAYEVPS